MRLPVRAARLTSVLRQLGIGAPVVLGAFLVTVLLLVLFGMGPALCFLVPAAPGSILLAGFVAARVDRRLDLRGACVLLDGDRLTVAPDLVFELDRPLVAESGWWNNQTKEPGAPGTPDASRGVHLYLRQDGREVLIHADDGNARAWDHQIAFRKPAVVPERKVRVWAADLVALIVGLRRSG